MRDIKLYLRYLCNILLICGITSCSAYQSNQQIGDDGLNSSLSGPFVLRQQVQPPADIQSLQLYPEGEPAAPPVIHLNGSQSLVLAFDHLTNQTAQFKITVSHRSQNWSESSIAPATYLGSFFESYFGGGLSSFTQTPSYRHYQYQFPNEELQITKSGNYLMSVYNSDSDKLLFRMPFFITENEGRLQTHIQTLFAQKDDAGVLAQPFTSYRYPSFVIQPRFDLSFSYAQNHFWGRMRTAEHLFTASDGVIKFHLGRDKAFFGNYEFNVLDIRSLQVDGGQIVNFLPGKTPPVVILKRDLQAFSATPPGFQGILELSLDDRQAQYAEVQFRLETVSDISESANIYLVGSFTNWAIDERYRMHFDVKDSLWAGTALVKQGIYAYKYVQLKNGRIDDLALNQSFTHNRQLYLTFVYYRDPELHYDRLLKVEKTFQ